jgi:hypothetical protein
MAEPPSPDHRDDVLLHGSTGAALYSTCATESEIHRANQNLKRAGQPARYVPVRHVKHHRQRQESGLHGLLQPAARPDG